MELNRPLYWLLDSCIRHPWPVRFLGAPNVEEIFNERSHGLDHRALIDALLSLFMADYMKATWVGENLSEDFFLPTHDQLRDDLRLGERKSRDGLTDHALYYFATPAGGELWEAYSNPDWDRYVYDIYGTDEYELTSRSLPEIERYIEMIRWSEGVSVMSDSMRSATIKPWQATYWKTLPDAHHVTFRPEQTGRFHLEQEWPPQLLKWWQEDPRWYTRWEG
jgi:hypothetical protein